MTAVDLGDEQTQKPTNVQGYITQYNQQPATGKSLLPGKPWNRCSSTTNTTLNIQLLILQAFLHILTHGAPLLLSMPGIRIPLRSPLQASSKVPLILTCRFLNRCPVGVAFNGLYSALGS